VCSSDLCQEVLTDEYVGGASDGEETQRKKRKACGIIGFHTEKMAAVQS